MEQQKLRQAVNVPCREFSTSEAGQHQLSGMHSRPWGEQVAAGRHQLSHTTVTISNKKKNLHRLSGKLPAPCLQVCFLGNSPKQNQYAYKTKQ